MSSSSPATSTSGSSLAAGSAQSRWRLLHVGRCCAVPLIGVAPAKPTVVGREGPRARLPSQGAPIYVVCLDGEGHSLKVAVIGERRTKAGLGLRTVSGSSKRGGGG